jgi:hypothetical protein
MSDICTFACVGEGVGAKGVRGRGQGGGGWVERVGVGAKRGHMDGGLGFNAWGVGTGNLSVLIPHKEQF